MKREYVFWPTQSPQLAVCLLLTLAWSSLAQTNFLFPVVTIRATDPFASESGDPGLFTVFRDGPTSNALNVFYLIGGTASAATVGWTLPTVLDGSVRSQSPTALSLVIS